MNKEFVNERELSLDEWVRLVKIPADERDFKLIDFQFPSDAHRDEYLRTISNRSDSEIKLLASLFLIDGGWLGSDESVRCALQLKSKTEFETLIAKSLFLNRVAIPQKDAPPWPSILWVIDLLPHFPQEAIDALNAFFQAHCMYFPDGRIHGLSDIEAIIKAKYMMHEMPVRQILLDLTSREFELLVAYLYLKKGYKVSITPRSRDGGYDVLAVRSSEREEERLFIECKRYEQPIGVAIVRHTLGLLSIKNASKAVVVTSSKFTKPAKDAAYSSKRAELIDFKALDNDMRTFVSYTWHNNVVSYISEIKRLLVNNKKEYLELIDT
ncbi:restriction endonuclease [Vibrio furnissii]|uniref:restriction endonuclease n=1 Tax=Vibrio furnissii TaxID=29494 RepID=UPI001EE9DE60|nr:restriction endonuclease [Vibrio furnissii]MCG6214730.1 restriction endonuclease [Vibrio furnissii]MCG6267964.1 restriction endonuclease [Vibrio furnissii]HCG7094558.1 restriction endonuclease [Vibrio parahaemolyticus]